MGEDDVYGYDVYDVLDTEQYTMYTLNMTSVRWPDGKHVCTLLAVTIHPRTPSWTSGKIHLSHCRVFNLESKGWMWGLSSPHTG